MKIKFGHRIVFLNKWDRIAIEEVPEGKNYFRYAIDGDEYMAGCYNTEEEAKSARQGLINQIDELIRSSK